MKVLLSTHSAATRASFGIVCREIWTRIVAADPSVRVVQHGWFHHPAVDKVPWEILPTRCLTWGDSPDGAPVDPDDAYGDKTFADVVRRVKPDLVWRLGDAYMGPTLAEVKANADFRLVYYYPVAREPFNHFREEWVRNLCAADRLIAATRYGAAILRAVPQLRGRRIPHISLGVNTATFRPMDESTRHALRRAIGGARMRRDAFVLGWVGYDQFRKQVWTLFELMYYLRSGNWIRCRDCGRITVKEYDHRLRRVRDTRRLRMYAPGYDYRSCWYCRSPNIAQGSPRRKAVLWTVMDNNLEVGYDLRLLADMYGVGDAVFNTTSCRGEAGHSFEQMSALYNCMDALVYPSGAEGFGMPVLEAMACGAPVVYSNYSAHAEYAVGLPVRVRLMPDAPDPSMLGLVDMGDFLRQVLALMDDAQARRRLAAKAAATARRMDWDRFTDRWLDVLHRLA